MQVTIDPDGKTYEYHLLYEDKKFVIGEVVEVYANRRWKKATVIRLTPNFVIVSYIKNMNGKLVVGRVDMRDYDSPNGLSFAKIRKEEVHNGITSVRNNKSLP